MSIAQFHRELETIKASLMRQPNTSGLLLGGGSMMAVGGMSGGSILNSMPFQGSQDLLRDLEIEDVDDLISNLPVSSSWDATVSGISVTNSSDFNVTANASSLPTTSAPTPVTVVSWSNVTGNVTNLTSTTTAGIQSAGSAAGPSGSVAALGNMAPNMGVGGRRLPVPVSLPQRGMMVSNKGPVSPGFGGVQVRSPGFVAQRSPGFIAASPSPTSNVAGSQQVGQRSPGSQTLMGNMLSPHGQGMLSPPGQGIMSPPPPGK